MKAYWGSGGIAPRILASALGGGGWVVSFTARGAISEIWNTNKILAGNPAGEETTLEILA
jgi:hypothetical protein